MKDHTPKKKQGKHKIHFKPAPEAKSDLTIQKTATKLDDFGLPVFKLDPNDTPEEQNDKINARKQALINQIAAAEKKLKDHQNSQDTQKNTALDKDK